MRPTPAGRHWDGSPRVHRPRALRLAATSPSRLLRAGQSSRCRQCGQPVHLHQRTDQGPIALHPAELPTAHVPEPCRWHLSGGIAHPHGDGTPWCRIPHAILCPRHTPACPPGPHLEAIRRHLAVRTRRLIDTGILTPLPLSDAAPPADARPSARPVVQILLVRYLAPGPLTALRCVARTRHRHRCPRPVVTAGSPAGHWILLSVSPQRGQLAWPETLMVVYDLSHLPCSEQLRWRAQRCPAHVTGSAADLTLPEWEPFDPLAHAAHIRARLPHSPASRGRVS
ncbi:DUF6083 domain-containing protein [Streptomyces chrestomyceticus]|uniref:DUF6083 domain-containing protein n=1 Tax=Streptomyces chrestomyceticus TaxID=68185 RepID=UPI00369BE01F